MTDLQKTEQSISGHIPPYALQQWIWSDHGQSLFETTMLFEKPIRSLDAWNRRGNYAFRARFAQDPVRGEICERLEIHVLGSSRPTSMNNIMPLQGLYFNASAKWLHEHLQEWNGTVEGTEEIDGTPCVLLSVSRVGLPRAKLWLDPERGYVVKKYVASTPESETGIEFVVDDYQQLDEGIWFPTKGTEKIDYLFVEWLVTEVAINTGIDDSRLTLPTPDVGTHVTDHVAGRAYRIAHEGERHVVRERIAAAAKQYRAVSGPPASAPPMFPPLLQWSLGLLAASLCLFLFSRYWSRRRRKSK